MFPKRYMTPRKHFRIIGVKYHLHIHTGTHQMRKEQQISHLSFGMTFPLPDYKGDVSPKLQPKKKDRASDWIEKTLLSSNFFQQIIPRKNIFVCLHPRKFSIIFHFFPQKFVGDILQWSSKDITHTFFVNLQGFGSAASCEMADVPQVMDGCAFLSGDKKSGWGANCSLDLCSLVE